MFDQVTFCCHVWGGRLQGQLAGRGQLLNSHNAQDGLITRNRPSQNSALLLVRKSDVPIMDPPSYRKQDSSLQSSAREARDLC